MQGCEKVGGGLEVSCGDAAEVFEAIEEPLNPVALAVEFPVHGSDDADIRLAGDVGRCPRSFDGSDHRLP